MPTLTVFVEPQGGLQGILVCQVDSEPLASLTLHLGSQLVASSQPQGVPTQPHVRISASPNALRLNIEEFGPSNQGEYVCTASNALGSASASAYFGTRGEGPLDNLSVWFKVITWGSLAQGLGDEVKVKISSVLLGSPWEEVLGA